MTRLFADDTNLTIYSNDSNELENMAINETRKLIKWCNSNKLTINFDKTNFILFHAKNKPIPPNFDKIIVDGNVVRRVASTKYLGLYMDELLTWRDHVSYIYIHKSLLRYFGIFNHLKYL